MTMRPILPNKPRPPIRPWAITAGLIAPVLLAVAFVVFAFFQGPNYSRLQHSISDMYAVGAPGGAALSWIIAVCGALTIAFVWFGFFPALGGTRLALVCSILFTLSIYGIGDLFAPVERLGCRLADAGCTEELQIANLGGLLDVALSTIGLLIFVAAVITTGFALRSDLILRRYGFFFMGAGSALAVWLVIGPLFASVGGLWERVMAYTGAAILLFLAVIVRRRYEPDTP